ncbi:hypothetical protein HUG10_17780 [Halorarum halophilum]|uniref:Uncharacterized protein n=1 Tax=Halorarum halophilum TaxID=2743090 RepID=A0A7D5GNA8_9EURY|nr:hypothetical protein [Halobaculum halophilum]QLG29267.1 hypothetical protein HUG10_17780 [Halobaculum halophilum]
MTGGFEFGADSPDDTLGSRLDPTASDGDDAANASVDTHHGTDSESVAPTDLIAEAEPGATSDPAVDSNRATTSTASANADPAADDPELTKLLYDGEVVEASVPVDGGRLVRTSHRLLVHTPGTDGRTLAVVQRPNVEGIRVVASGRGGYVAPALKAILVGGVLVAAGATVPLDGMADVAPSASGAGATGMGGTVALLGSLLSAIALLDDVLRVVGALALLVGVALLGLYLRSRKREIVVSVAGDEDLRVSAADVAEGDVARLVPES